MRSFLISFSCFVIIACSATFPEKRSINGVSFVASNEAINQKHIEPVLNINSNYASVMPFAFIRNLNSPEVIYNTKRQWFGETEEGAKQYIKMLQKNKIKIMLKPQIWVWKGEFTGDIEMKTEDDWKNFETSYSNYILDYARLAEEMQVEIVCIGTELNKFVSERPDYWVQLIKKLKSVYKGKLTYAENWDSYANVPFWNELDYIGIDAYFPLSDEKYPTKEALSNGWIAHKAKMKSVSISHRKQVVFTEYGYRSADYAAKEPWDSSRKINTVNLEAQSIALEVMFEEFWQEDWFAGGFLWKWFHNHDKAGGTNNNRFTPQNKPAESIVQDNYSFN